MTREQEAEQIVQIFVKRAKAVSDHPINWDVLLDTSNVRVAVKEILKEISLRTQQAQQERDARIAEDEKNLSMVGGSTGDAIGTAKRIATAIREGKHE